jgi:hypothetical protein
MADETRDVSVVHERFLGFIRLEEFDAESLAEKLANFLKSLEINLSD